MSNILFNVLRDDEGEPVLKGRDGDSNVIVEFNRDVFQDSADKAERKRAANEQRDQLGSIANRKLAEGKFDLRPRAGGEYRHVVLTAKDVKGS